MTLNSRFVFFCSMLGLVLASRGLPVAAFIPIGLISIISGKRFGAYATLIWFSINVSSLWSVYLGTMEGMSIAFKGLLNHELLQLPAYAQQTVISEPVFQNAIAAFSGWMPYVYAGIAAVTAGCAMFVLGWLFFAVCPSLKRRLQAVAQMSERL